MNRFKIISFSLLLAAVCYSSLLMAQTPGPPGPGTGGPVDGGAVALVAGAAIYGYKRLKEKNKQHRENQPQ